MNVFNIYRFVGIHFMWLLDYEIKFCNNVTVIKDHKMAQLLMEKESIWKKKKSSLAKHPAFTLVDFLVFIIH